MVIFGPGYANLFAVIFSLSLKRVPDRVNEVSALLIMGVSGGALLPPLPGVFSGSFDTQTGRHDPDHSGLALHGLAD